MKSKWQKRSSSLVKSCCQSTELANQLEQFISNIENKANLDEQQSGEKLLKSLTDTFEKLNQSIEQGIEQVETEK